MGHARGLEDRALPLVRPLGGHCGAISPPGLWSAAPPQGVGRTEESAESMTITIRRLEHSDHEYIAYTKSMCGRATYFLYFEDGIWGAVVLCNFVQMLKAQFQPERLKLSVHENAASLHNPQILELLKEGA